MTWFAAVTTGFGLGLISFGALWLTVQKLVCRPQRTVLMGASGFARLLLVGLVFYTLSCEGADKVVAGLGGLWLARWCLIRRLGGAWHGR